ncbi:MAG: HEPN domain-containing protein [Nanoarchaeota archaeon]
MRYIALKIKRGLGLLKTHDCFGLAKRIKATRKVLEASEILSPYYARTRYPDALLINIDFSDIQRIKKAAGVVLQWTKKHC